MDPEKSSKLTKKEKQQISRENAKQRLLEQKTVPRRAFLKAIIPGGWVPEVIHAGGLGGLSTAGKVSLIKDVALVSSSVGLGLKAGGLLGKEGEEANFKDKVLKFGWKNAEDSSKLQNFVDAAAEEYINLTKTPRLTKSELTSQTIFCRSDDEYLKTVRAIEPSYFPPPNYWGYTDYKTHKLVIDLASLKAQVIEASQSQKIDPELTAGKALITSLWHEWGHLDVTERNEGKNLNNPDIYFRSPVSMKNGLWKKYRGGTVYTDTYYGYVRFDEVLNETINVRRMTEQLGLDKTVSTGNYYQNGVDIFWDFTRKTGISLDTLYQAHATSDFEGLAKIVGDNLPGNEDPNVKGLRLFTALHQANPDLINQTGIRSVLK